MHNDELQKEERFNSNMWDIVENVEQSLLEMLATARSTEDGDLQEFVDRHYYSLLQNIVYQITSLPADRFENGLEPASDITEMSEGYNQLIESLTSAFGYDKKRIEKDMKQYTRKYTPEDIFVVRKLRKENMLH